MHKADIAHRTGHMQQIINSKSTVIKLFRLLIGVVVVVAMGSSISFALSPGATKTNSIVSTEAYLKAKDTFAHALLRDASSSVGLQNMLVRQTARECPNLLRDAPHNHNEREVARWIIHAVTLTVFRASSRAIVQFDAETQNLRWRNKRIEALVRMLDTRRRFLAEIPLPDLCGGARAWAGGGFRTLPADIIRLNKLMSPIALGDVAEGPGTYEETLLRLLMPYETLHELAIAHQIGLIKRQASQQSQDVLHPAWIQIYDKIGL